MTEKLSLSFRRMLFTFQIFRRIFWISIVSSALAWRIPGTGEPGGLPSMWSHRVGHDRSDLAVAAHGNKVMLKILKPGFSNTCTVNFQMFKLVLEKAEELEPQDMERDGHWGQV